MKLKTRKFLVLSLIFMIFALIVLIIYGHLVHNKLLSTFTSLIGFGFLVAINKLWLSELEGMPWSWKDKH